MSYSTFQGVRKPLTTAEQETADIFAPRLSADDIEDLVETFRERQELKSRINAPSCPPLFPLLEMCDQLWSEDYESFILDDGAPEGCKLRIDLDQFENEDHLRSNPGQVFILPQSEEDFQPLSWTDPKTGDVALMLFWDAFEDNIAREEEYNNRVRFYNPICWIGAPDDESLPGESITHEQYWDRQSNCRIEYPPFLKEICDAKKMPIDAAIVYGAQIAYWYDEAVVEFPTYDEFGNQCGRFAIESPEAKGRFAKGEKAGLFFPHVNGSPRLPQPEETWLLVEGVKDAAALHKLGYNVCGLNTCSLNKKFAILFADVHVVLVPDLDTAGQTGAKRSAANLASYASRVRIVRLPGDIKDKSGDDCRDVLAKEDGPRLISVAIESAASAEVESTIPILSAKEFFSEQYAHEYLIEGVLVKREPCVVGGKAKSLKTTICGVDLALSLAAGTPWLGEFPTRQCRVLILSGESGTRTLQETANRIAKAKNIDPAEGDSFWGFELPCLGSEEGLKALEKVLSENKIEVVIFDPLYLSFIGPETKGLNASNLFDVGPLLLQMMRVFKRTNTTPILIHHCRKNSPNAKFSPPELDELAMSGFGEFARQWILLGRRADYRGDGDHKLWLTFGGSAGHGGVYALDVDEGTDASPSGRRWELKLMQESEVREKESKLRQDEKAATAAIQLVDDTQAILDAMVKLAGSQGTKTEIRDAAGIRTQRFNIALASLINDGKISSVDIKKGNNRKYDGYQLKS